MREIENAISTTKFVTCLKPVNGEHQHRDTRGRRKQVKQNTFKDSTHYSIMFRSKKKKINAGSRRTVRTFDDEDENDVGTTDGAQRQDVDEPPSALLIALQQKKAKKEKKRNKSKRKIGTGGPLVMSFDIEEADENEEDDSSRRKKKKKRKKGLGFGGGGGNAIDYEVDMQIEDQMGTSAYGKEALEKLKSEQKRQIVPPAPVQSAPTSPKPETTDGDPIILNSYENIPEENYIPLDDQGQDPASSVEKKEKEKMFALDDPPPDESHGWERQIEQRAGLKPSSQTSQIPNTKLLSLDQLSEKLKSTVETIDRQREELENSTNRLRADREHAKSKSQEHQNNLRTTGLACEFYQSTRRDLTLWVGALRDLHQKVEPIAKAFLEMLQVQTKDFGHEFRAWQDDCVATLYQTHRLDRVLGRQPDSTLLTTASNETVIDEFGRDIGSQYQRDRESRFKVRVEYMNRSDDATATGIIKCEDHDEDERAKILQEALSVALEDLDQEYTSATLLKSIFDEWFAAYFDDYQQCFATLSFGDLYAVLIQVELYKSDFFSNILSSVREVDQRILLALDRCFVEPSKEPIKEDNTAKKSQTNRVATENAGRLTRIVEKGILPLLTKILNPTENEDSFHLFFSTSKSRLISRLIQDAAFRPLQQGEKSIPESDPSSRNSSVQQQLQRLVNAAIQKSLENVSIPLLNKESGGDNTSEGLDCSIKYARLYQIQILQQTLCNMILHWFPLIDLDVDSGSESGIHFVLNFINDKYLVLLSSMDNSNEEQSAKDFFKQIWEALNADSRNIIESPSLMLLTMPLRAAARAYQLN